MLDELERQHGWLAQDDVALAIERRFGRDFVYENDAGNLAISRKVLDAFRKITAQTVVWDRAERAWRKREPHDPKGRLAE